MESTLIWMSLIFFIGASADRDILLTSDLSNTNVGFPISNYSKYDLDGNTNEMSVDLNGNQIIIRSDTMPDPSDPNAANVRENNAVMFPYIANPANNSMMHISLEFSHEAQCPTYSVDGVQCSNELELRVYKAEADTDPQSLLTGGVAPIHTYILNSSSSATGSPQEFNQYPDFAPATTSGIRLALVDKGSSFKVNLFSVSRYYCSWTVPTGQLPIFCDETPASHPGPRIGTCTCGPNSKGREGFLVINNCEFHPDVPDAGFSGVSVPCVCKAGYVEEVSQGKYDRECKEAPPTTPSSSTPGQSDGTDPTISDPTISDSSTPADDSSSTAAPDPDSSTVKDDNSALVLSGVSLSLWLAVYLILTLFR